MKIILLQITLFLLPLSEAWGFDWKFWQSSEERKEIESHEEYDFPSCASFARPEVSTYEISCRSQDGIEQGTHLGPAASELVTNAENISRKAYEDFLTEDLRTFILTSLEEKVKRQLDLRDCLALIVGRHQGVSEWCQNKAHVLRQEAREQYPRMRLHMALKRPIATPVVGEEPRFDIMPHIYHARDKTKLEPLHELEMPQIRAQFDEESHTYSQEWLALHHDKGCIVKDENGLYRFMAPECSKTHRLIHNDYINLTRQEKTAEHDAIYRQLLGENPHFAFMQPALLPPNDQALNVMLANSLADLVTQSSLEYEKLIQKPSSDFKFAYRFSDLIESYLKERGAHQLACDGLQNMHDQYGEGGWDDLTKDLGLGLAAIAGGGACLLSGGLACAAVVAVGAEGIFISRDQARLNEGLSLYQAGLISSSKVDELESNRNFSIALAPLAFVGLEGGRAVRGAGGNFAKRYFSRETLKNTQHWLHYTATNPLENRSWIRAARNSSAQIYFDVENAALKRLNDTLGDKNIVTALTNLHKHVLFDEMQTLLDKYPGLKVEKYSDFKSARFAFNFPNGQVPADFQTELNLVMSRVNQRFDEEVTKIEGLNLAEQNPHQWFKSGMGQTADQAGLATRQARSAERTSAVKSFAEVSGELAQKRSNIESSRVLLQKMLQGDSAKLLTNSDIGVKVPSLEVFELLRKAKGKSDAEVAELIKKRFNVSLTTEQASSLSKYASEVDQFSPGLWLEDRVVANLDEAEFGGFSADFKGMGARNLQQVALDLAHPKDDLAAAVERLRAGEAQVTSGFDQAKSSYQQLIARELKGMGVEVINKCSGDDCVSLPAKTLTRAQEQKVLDSIARSGSADGYRLSFIPPGIKASDRTNLAVHGELIEKEVRAILTGFGPGKVAPEVMSQIAMGVRMPREVGKGSIELMLSEGRSGVLTPELRQTLDLALSEAAVKVNHNLATELGSEFAYQAGPKRLSF